MSESIFKYVPGPTRNTELQIIMNQNILKEMNKISMVAIEFVQTIYEKARPFVCPQIGHTGSKYSLQFLIATIPVRIIVKET